MKIGIDIRDLSSQNDRAGQFQYTSNLISSLLALDPEHDYVLLSSRRMVLSNRRIPEALIRRFPGSISRLILERLSLPIETLMGRLDIFHGPSFFAPRSFRCPTIVTIHDLMPFKHPEFLKPGWVSGLKKKILASVKRADAVIAVSEFTKREIMDFFKVPSERVRVIHDGIEPFLRPVQDRPTISGARNKYGLYEPYLLFVGNIEPKKNLEKLVHAYATLRNSILHKYRLVIVGNKGWYFPKLWEVVQRFGLEKEVIFTGIVEEAELATLYGGAELFVFPSLFEGFGIPVIEAMASGIPVAASNRASIPEIAGDAALLFDPMNVDEIAETMQRALASPELRRRLVERGLERAKEFSWERTARETLRLYKDLAGVSE